jgi:hypothetical protein
VRSSATRCTHCKTVSRPSLLVRLAEELVEKLVVPALRGVLCSA